MLCIVTRRLRIPLMWTLLDKQGSSSGAERIALMQRYLELFGAGSIRYLLADREFIGPEWIGFLLRNKVIFSIRVKANMAVVLETGRTHLLETLLRKRDGRTLLRKHEGRFATMPSNLGTPLRFACKELDNGELLIIVSNSENPSEALRVYKRRWFIEYLFRDGKSGGLNMEDTHLTDLEKLSLLTAIVTLAMVWSYACARRKMGRRGIAKGPHGYLRKSWFRTGFDLLRNWILHSQDKAAEVWTTLWPNAKKPLQFVRVV